MGKVGLNGLDGLGVGKERIGNGVGEGKKGNFDRYWNRYRDREVRGWGEGVGLGEGEMGKWEVGDLNMGGGRIV